MSNKEQTHGKVTDTGASMRPIYLDCNATTPIDEEVREVVKAWMEEEFGNAGSRTHEYGNRAKIAVKKARDSIAVAVKSQSDEIIFTSGATESNNIAILGIAAFGNQTGRRHIVSTQIEHAAVLEPLEEMARRGFEVELLPPNRGGWVEIERIRSALRPDTLMVSMMHANNETGVVQPIEEVTSLLKEHPAFLHVDAAQTFGKVLKPLQDPRVDLISASSHKIFGPQGVGALVTRRRRFERTPLQAVTFGGGQERGLRPGTLPVALIIGFGKAMELAVELHQLRASKCLEFRKTLQSALSWINPIINGDQARSLPHVLNFTIPGVNSEAAMLALKHLLAISNGSACTSASYKPSHVLQAMGLPEYQIAGALRLSWCHATPAVDWEEVIRAIGSLRPTFSQ
jgi:cysteine desulfurase